MQIKIFLFALLMLSSTLLLGQTAYIEVKGEPDLSVYLNSKFKSKTTAELGGCIIENITPGKNLIKIVKEGFIPFEETITIKPNEVFSYTVKPLEKKEYHSQENFTERKLKFIQDVANNTNFNTIETYMVNNNYKLADSYKEQSHYVYIYDSKFSQITIMYTPSKTLSLIENLIPTFSIAFIESELKSKKFTITKTNKNINFWKKNKYPYQFLVENTNEPGSVFILITKEYEQYVK